MIVFGVVLLTIGIIAHVSILSTLGVIAILVGAVLYIAGNAGHPVGGRPHWY